MSTGLPGCLITAIEALGGGTPRDATPLGDGAFCIRLRSGDRVFGKTAANVPADLYAAERSGLEAIAATGTIATPAVLASSPDCLILEWLGGVRAPGYWQNLGEQLAALHKCHGDSFGFFADNYCGMTPQPNPDTQDGFAFFADARLRHQARLARNAGHLDEGDSRQLEHLLHRLPDWIPDQPPSLIHGDLWSGNIACTSSGQPALIDPAVHYGWHEAELAMTTLFGGFDPRFYAAYEAESGCDPGWRERAPLYNLYHLLNHVNLFGTHYCGAVRSVLKRYSGTGA